GRPKRSTTGCGHGSRTTPTCPCSPAKSGVAPTVGRRTSPLTAPVRRTPMSNGTGRMCARVVVRTFAGTGSCRTQPRPGHTDEWKDEHMTISANLPDPDRRPTPPPTGCWTCDFIGPAESGFQGDLVEMHRAVYQFGQAVTTPLAPIVGRINREPNRAYRYRPWMGPFNWV